MGPGGDPYPANDMTKEDSMKKENCMRNSQANAIPATPNPRMHPVFECPNGADFLFGGIVGDRIQANLENWLLVAPKSNPAMMEYFHDRERIQRETTVPWFGWYAGTYLISAVQSYKITRDPRLKAQIQDIVDQLVGCQEKDGYMGVWPKEGRPFTPNLYPGQLYHVWDAWSHMDYVVGLLLWWHEEGDKAAFDACRRTADYWRDVITDGIRVPSEHGWMYAQSSIQIFTLMYQETGDASYLRAVDVIEKHLQDEPAPECRPDCRMGDYLRSALAGKAMYQFPNTRWERLKEIQALAQLYYITGDEKYQKAFAQIWWSIVEFDRHNTGAFSTVESACGNPYAAGSIETCCSIAWQALTVDMLRMAGDSRVADELEFTTLNEVLGAQSPSGRWWTYDTPMDGERRAAAHSIVFQSRAAGPELSCCSTNAPRGLGVLSDWAVMTAKDGVVLNYYGPSEFACSLPSGERVKLAQKTDYPVSGDIHLTVSPDSQQRFALHLRIPGWSRRTQVILNGKPLSDPTPGKYLALDREWKPGDEVNLSFDMSPRLWVGERECQGKISIYHGPLLLAFDPRYNTYKEWEIDGVDFAQPPTMAPAWERDPKPLLLLRFFTKGGTAITLCDFATAGVTGNNYVSWIRPQREYQLPLTWRFRTDPHGEGEQARWFDVEPGAGWADIQTDRSWRKQGFEHYDGMAWYSVDFSCPQELANKRVALGFGAVDGICWVWLDGMPVGCQLDPPEKMWNRPFVLELPGPLKTGTRHRLAVKVIKENYDAGVCKPVFLSVTGSSEFQPIPFTRDNPFRAVYPPKIEQNTRT